MPNTVEILTKTVVPAVGVIISVGMYLSPLRAVLKADKASCLGDLNPVPFAITILSTSPWLVYGLLRRDPYLMASCVVGLPSAMFNTLTMYNLAEEKMRITVRAIVCSSCIILSTCGIVSAFGPQDPNVYIGLWGWLGNVVSLMYYASPLSSMAKIIRSKNSSSILLPLTIMNLANSLLWTVYGLAINDRLVWAISALGMFMCLLQVVLRLLYKASPQLPSLLPSITCA